MKYEEKTIALGGKKSGKNARRAVVNQRAFFMKLGSLLVASEISQPDTA